MRPATKFTPGEWKTVKPGHGHETPHAVQEWIAAHYPTPEGEGQEP
jgi:hypothetical protein